MTTLEKQLYLSLKEAFDVASMLAVESSKNVLVEVIRARRKWDEAIQEYERLAEAEQKQVY